jgi:hypothetical protein
VIGYCCFGEPCFLLHSEDGGSKVLWNVSILLLQHYTSQPRRPWLVPVHCSMLAFILWHLHYSFTCFIL